MTELKCPNCGAGHYFLRLRVQVDVPIELDENGATGKIDVSGWTTADVRENIAGEQNAEIHCRRCDALFKAVWHEDEYTFAAGEPV